jgi:hypothetical protein
MPIGKFVTTMRRVLRVPPNLEKSTTAVLDGAYQSYIPTKFLFDHDCV